MYDWFPHQYGELQGSKYYAPYFSDYKTHCTPQIWEENGGASYNTNVAYLAHRVGGLFIIKYFTTFFASKIFSYFPPLKLRCILWSENTVFHVFTPSQTLHSDGFMVGEWQIRGYYYFIFLLTKAAEK